MSSFTRRTGTVAVTLAAGSALVLTGTAAASPTAAGTASPAPAVASAPLVEGLYQSAYSERNDALWVTSAVGRPPVTQSALLRVDPRTLEIEQTIVPPVTDGATGAVEAVYGIDVDDEHNTVWTTNTRDNSVSVYSQRTGEHLATLPGVDHAREIVVDERHNTVWASAFGSGTLVAFDSRTFEEKDRVTVEGAGPTGLAVDERSGTVYAADLSGDRIIEVGPDDEAPRFIPTGDGPISIDLSENGRTAYTADQTGGTLSVVDLRSGTVERTVPTGEGALSVEVEPRTDRVVVVNRTAATVSVVDARRGRVVDTIATGANPNHVETVRGTAFVVDKSGAGAAPDQLYRIRVGR
ncbi:YncE family protein [Streptomyces sp. RFCAC02]|uniref:YncE family protein n=1 Tax=Streptomyces sp. RFCAC02 TaxID=2499143 RepID=UPI00101F4FA5|nr:YncE family protein [Streptomyces sp. RFCAC02]